MTSISERSRPDSIQLAALIQTDLVLVVQVKEICIAATS